MGTKGIWHRPLGEVSDKELSEKWDKAFGKKDKRVEQDPELNGGGGDVTPSRNKTEKDSDSMENATGESVNQYTGEAYKIAGRLKSMLRKRPLGTCTVKEGAFWIGVPLDTVVGVLETCTFQRLIYNPDEGRIWRD